MSGRQGPQNPDVRAAFLAALEYGVSPLVAAEYRRPPRACDRCGKPTRRTHRRPIDCERGRNR